MSKGGKQRSRAAKQRRSRKREFKRRPWLLHRGPVCERCGFVPVDPCQLAVDHIDGDKGNSQSSNYQTLCHNCHALKTKLMRDWEGSSGAEPQPDAQVDWVGGLKLVGGGE